MRVFEATQPGGEDSSVVTEGDRRVAIRPNIPPIGILIDQEAKLIVNLAGRAGANARARARTLTTQPEKMSINRSDHLSECSRVRGSCGVLEHFNPNSVLIHDGWHRHNPSPEDGRVSVSPSIHPPIHPSIAPDEFSRRNDRGVKAPVRRPFVPRSPLQRSAQLPTPEPPCSPPV